MNAVAVIIGVCDPLYVPSFSSCSSRYSSDWYDKDETLHSGSCTIGTGTQSSLESIGPRLKMKAGGSLWSHVWQDACQRRERIHARRPHVRAESYQDKTPSTWNWYAIPAIKMGFLSKWVSLGRTKTTKAPVERSRIITNLLHPIKKSQDQKCRCSKCLT